jgi:hypothetical protein
LTIYAQLVKDSRNSYPFVLGSMKSVLAAVLAPFLFIKVDTDHRRISEILEVEG